MTERDESTYVELECNSPMALPMTWHLKRAITLHLKTNLKSIFVYPNKSTVIKILF